MLVNPIESNFGKVLARFMVEDGDVCGADGSAM